MNQGYSIALEGIDGSGKATQVEMLTQRLRKDKHKVFCIAFPRYGTPAARGIEEYLQGKQPNADVYEVSKIYARDRQDATPQIQEWLSQRAVVVIDRFVGSNMAHQGGKISDTTEREKFCKWLDNFEYNELHIPRPDLQIFLDVSPTPAQTLRGSDEKRQHTTDIHEKSNTHLKNAYQVYKKDFLNFYSNAYAVECEEGGEMRSKQDIHQDVYNLTKRFRVL